MSTEPQPIILPCGDEALVVEFGRVIDPAINDRVLALDAALGALAWPGVRETVPTYRSLLVHYDPAVVDHATLSERLLALARTLDGGARSGRTWEVPVVYGGAYGEDLGPFAARLGLTPEAVVARHTGATYRVYMLGFSPGFSYLGGLDPGLATPRREDPRLVTPAGTISVGGMQTAVQCLAGPSGWHLLGRTPVRTYLAGREPVFLLEPGDAVRFYPVAAGEFAAMDAAAEAGDPVARLAA